MTSQYFGFLDELADFQRPFTQKSAKMWPQIVFLLEYIAGVGLCLYASVVVGVIAFYVTLEKGAPFWEICATKFVELYQMFCEWLHGTFKVGLIGGLEIVVIPQLIGWGADILTLRAFHLTLQVGDSPCASPINISPIYPPPLTPGGIIYPAGW